MPKPITIGSVRLYRHPLALDILSDTGSVCLDTNEIEGTLRFIKEQFPLIYDKVVLESGEFIQRP